MGANKTCSQCGEHLEDEWKKCPSCLSNTTEKLTCKVCSKTLKPGWKICPYCETQISSYNVRKSSGAEGELPWLSVERGDSQQHKSHRMPEFTAGEELLGQYRVIEKIGSGAKGVVYRVLHLALNEEIAIKAVGSFDSVDGLLKEYRDEYKAQKSIRHKHVLDVEAPAKLTKHNVNYLILPMELARESFSDWLRRYPADDEKRLEKGLSLFRQACLGVQAIHTKGLVHLDLKPANLLLTDSEENPILKVADFGLSRSMSRQEQRGSLFSDGIGTPAYMAPEQIKAAHWKDVGPPADIYALGMILYELLDGDLPYSGSGEQIKQKKLDKDLSIRTPGGLKPLSHVVLRSIALADQQRIGSVKELLDEMNLNLKKHRESEKNREKATKLSKKANQKYVQGDLIEARILLEEAYNLDKDNKQIAKGLRAVTKELNEKKEEETNRKKRLEEQKREREKRLKKEEEKRRKEAYRKKKVEEERKLQEKKKLAEKKKREDLRILEEFLLNKNFPLNLSGAANISIKDEFGETLLHRASNSGKIRVVRILIEQGADVNAKDHRDETPLHEAASVDGKVGVVKMLIERGADVNAKDDRGETPLFSAARLGRLDIAKELILSGGNIHEKNNSDESLLHNAARSGVNNREMIQFLIDYGISVDIKTKVEISEFFLSVLIGGRTPLFYAKSMHNIKALIENGAEINARDASGDTPLHFKIEASTGSLIGITTEVDIIKYLIDNGADIYAKNNEGERPIDLIKRKIVNVKDTDRMFGSTSTSKIKNLRKIKRLLEKRYKY